MLCITDHVLPSWQPWRGVDSTRFDAYLVELEAKKSALRLYDLLPILGLELTFDPPTPIARVMPSRSASANRSRWTTGSFRRSAGRVREPRSSPRTRTALSGTRPPAARGSSGVAGPGSRSLVDRYELFNRRQVSPGWPTPGFPWSRPATSTGFTNLAGWKTMLECTSKRRPSSSASDRRRRAYLVPWGRDLVLPKRAAA